MFLWRDMVGAPQGHMARQKCISFVVWLFASFRAETGSGLTCDMAGNVFKRANYYLSHFFLSSHSCMRLREKAVCLTWTRPHVLTLLYGGHPSVWLLLEKWVPSRPADYSCSNKSHETIPIHTCGKLLKIKYDVYSSVLYIDSRDRDAIIFNLFLSFLSKGCSDTVLLVTCWQLLSTWDLKTHWHIWDHHES